MLLFRLLEEFLLWAYPSLSSSEAGSVFASLSNFCSCCLSVWEFFLVCSVLPMSVSESLRGLYIPALLVLSLNPFSVVAALCPLSIIGSFQLLGRVWLVAWGVQWRGLDLGGA